MMTDSSDFNHRDALGVPVGMDAIIAKARQSGFTQSYIEMTGKLAAEALAREEDKYFQNILNEWGQRELTDDAYRRNFESTVNLAAMKTPGTVPVLHGFVTESQPGCTCWYCGPHRWAWEDIEK